MQAGADKVEDDGGHGDTPERAYAPERELVGDEAAQHDELALDDVDDVHHAPDQRHAVGRDGEDGADHQPVQQELEDEERRVA